MPTKNKYKDPAYRANVRAWIRGLKHADAKAAHEQAFRDSRRGDLATGGAAALRE